MVLARVVKFEKSGPYLIEKVESIEKKIVLCGCGLSSNKPYCDGSHTACKGEEANKTYIYDKNKKRRETYWKDV